MPDPREVELPAGLRRVTDTDAEAVTALIAGAYAEHPGCVLDLPGVDDDLPQPGTTAARRGSPWWVVERDGTLVATIAASPIADGTVELKRLYLAPAVRGRGLASQLVRLVEQHAAGLGATRVELWSDTRFLDAHGRYAALGYVPTGATRELHDPSDTTELRFVRAVEPAGPETTVAWDGPYGRETATLTRLPDGWLLRTELPAPAVRATVEVDGAWRTRRAAIHGDSDLRLLTSDAAGRWWLGGEPAPQLAGAVDVDVEVTPLTNTLPIRRLLADHTDDAEVTAAWVRVPGDAVERLEQRYTRSAGDRWHYTSGRFEAELTVDAHGLVTTYGDLWRRV